MIRVALGLAAAVPAAAGLPPAAAVPGQTAAVAAQGASAPTEGEFPGVGRPPVRRIVVDRPASGPADGREHGLEPGPDLAAPASPPAQTVTVTPGDSLWVIAARHLGSDASIRQIAAEWPRWFAANRDEIGPDPDHIVPGTTLRVPPAVP
jgi:nucleoid-associated protein YgaU